VTIDSAPDGLINDATPLFSGTADVEGDVIVTIDSASYVTEIVGGSWAIEVPTQAEGDHTFTIDLLDLGSTIGSGDFTVDSIAPDLSVAPPAWEAPDRHTTSTTATFGVTSEPGSTVTYSLDGDSPVPVGGSSVQLTDLSVGVHAIQFLAVDSAGNETRVSSDWTVDSLVAPVVAPSVPATLAVAATVGEQTTIDLDDYVTPGTHTVTGFDAWSPDGTALGFAFDWATTHVVTLYPATAGTFTFTFSVSTEEGEQSDDATVTVTVAEAPLVSATWVARPDASTTSTTARFAIGTDAGATVEYVLDLPEGAQSASPVGVDGTEFTLTGLSGGRHTIRIYAVLRGHYSEPMDYVWEVVGTSPAAAPVAAPALATGAIPAAQISRGIRQGATGPSVSIIQRVVGATADGIFGRNTRAAIVAFQRAHGLVADGIVGPQTWAAIVDVANGGTGIRPVTTSSIPQAQINRGISNGASGSAVSIIQRAVGASADGRFGPRTTAAVRTFQRAHGLTPDGIVGRLTWAKILEVTSR
jgi:peptidoglycan hydrolase-like protein with peptidoglycan-binding domain